MGNNPPKLYLGPLALLSLDTPSLTSPCYSGLGSINKGLEVEDTSRNNKICNIENTGIRESEESIQEGESGKDIEGGDNRRYGDRGTEDRG